ncbi:MAG TPA: TIGR02996 domain-containing protein [Gemmataceae bacterium]|nr:TIGR02996 domain-containing protein [Gemmataceae bacterium]
MDERQGFLKALAKNEDDTTTRMVYADWLDERGEHEESDRQRKWPAAKTWLVEFAERHSVGYSELIDAIVSGEGLCFGDLDGPEAMENPEVWKNLEIVTGKRFTSDERENIHFRCAC